ncbi:cellulase family glycosylhydrolase [Streptomyces sp. NPDC046977]|uniref:cellulase family glycosylhydrolase n=1 Tax=Streptomyces sp. NPDC046977 TaxID=3154703 RepID=UPI0033F45E75
MVKETSRRQRFLVALVAFVVSGVATIVAASLPSASSPSAPHAAGGRTPTPSASHTSSVRDVRMGVSYGDTLTWKSDADLARGLNDAVAIGAKWVRMDLSWNNIQPDSPYGYEWQRFDRVAKAARARGLNVLPVIAYTPKWARVSGCTSSQNCAPADPDIFAAFAKMVAERYAPMGIHTWEVWNEENIGFWKPAADPKAYTELLRVTSQALRAADPKAYVVMGGLAVSGTTDRNMSPTDFLDAVSKLGGNKYVDAVGYHPFNYPTLPSATPGTGTPFERISSARDNLVAVLGKYGTPGTPIWLTETGAPTSGPGAVSDGRTVPANTTHVTEARQAEIAADTIPTVVANSHVAAMFWYTDQDLAPAEQKKERALYYGMRRFDGTKKPSFDALRQAITGYEHEKG